MASTTAASQVGSTTELIELILSDLPLLDIIAASAVNKTFRNVILNSPMLQRKLFLRPTNALPRYWLPLEQYHDRTLFRTVTVDPDSSIFQPTSESRLDQHNFPLRVVSTCPLLKRPNEAKGSWTPYETFHQSIKWNSLSTSPHQWYLLPTKEASGRWKQMFLTDPPRKSVQCTLRWEGWFRVVLDITLEATRYVYRQAGVTFADLFDDTCNMPGPVLLQTACDDGHWMTMPRAGGGYECHIPITSLHAQIERVEKNNSQREMRFSKQSTVALPWTVALTERERHEIAAKANDIFYFIPDMETQTRYWRR
jgi:hypothetical protein